MSPFSAMNFVSDFFDCCTTVNGRGTPLEAFTFLLTSDVSCLSFHLLKTTDAALREVTSKDTPGSVFSCILFFSRDSVHSSFYQSLGQRGRFVELLGIASTAA